MNEVLNLGGELLSALIDKSSMVCRGLFRFAFKDDGKEDCIENNSISYDDFIHVVNNGLKSRLEKIKIGSTDTITIQLKEKIKAKQAIYTMNK